MLDLRSHPEFHWPLSLANIVLTQCLRVSWQSSSHTLTWVIQSHEQPVTFLEVCVCMLRSRLVHNALITQTIINQNCTEDTKHSWPTKITTYSSIDKPVHSAQDTAALRLWSRWHQDTEVTVSHYFHRNNNLILNAEWMKYLGSIHSER